MFNINVMKKNIAIVLTIYSIIFFSVNIFGQNLERQTTLGARLDMLSETNNTSHLDYGLYISAIKPDGTLGSMGVKSGMVLQKINNVKITSRSDVQSALKTIRENNAIEVVVNDNGSAKTFLGRAIGKPKEVHPKATVYYDEVVYKDNKLRSLLYIPKGATTPPVVFYLQGYTCQSIEYNASMPMKKLIDQWIDSGFAVYLVEKPGLGDSDCKVACAEINFHQEMEGFSQAYKQLFKNSNIDTKNVFLYGHSMGGVVAPILAQQIRPKGVMVFGTVGKSWFEYMKDVVTEQQMLFGSTKAQVTENSKQSFPFLEDLMLNRRSNTEMINNPKYKEYLQDQGVDKSLKNGYYMGRHYTFWQSLGDIDIPKEWSKVNTNVYIMHGEFDVQAINAKYAKMIETNVNSNKGKAEFSIIPKTDHVFIKFASMKDNIEALTNGTYSTLLRNNYNPEVAEYSIKWMNKLID